MLKPVGPVLADVLANVSFVKTDMSEGWMRDHPDLAGKALLRFYHDHPPTEYEITIKRANMPGMLLSLCARRREN